MRLPRVIFCFLLIALPAVAQVPTAADDEKLLRDKGLAIDPASLVQYFRDRTLSPERQDALATQIGLLGHADYQKRRQAHGELLRAGKLAKPLLVEVVKQPALDLEIRRRAELCLHAILENPEIAVSSASARLLAHRPTMEAPQTLLDFYPFAMDPFLQENLQLALNKLALHDGQPVDAIVQALQDKRPSKRAAAGEALVRSAGLTFKDLLIPLLKDPAPQVRAQLGIALAENKDAAAIPILIDTLDRLPYDEALPVQDLLFRLAGEQGPSVYLGSKTPAPQVKQQWQAWWTKTSAKIDLAKLTEVPKLRNLTLISMMGNGTAGSVHEIKPDGKVAWKVSNLMYPVDAQMIGDDRVLVAEYMGSKVTERDVKENKILWSKQISLPISCQRLPNGHTFIATRKVVVIVDAGGKEVFTFSPGNISISAATWARDGHVYVIGSTGQLHKVDPEGKVAKTFQVGFVYALGGGIEVAPNGRLLVPLYRDNKVVEFSPDGQVLWEATVANPSAVSRLPNGNLLVVTMADNRIVEINRDGRTVWEHRTEFRPWRARKR